jgi:hypothetical protein
VTSILIANISKSRLNAKFHSRGTETGRIRVAPGTEVDACLLAKSHRGRDSVGAKFPQGV